ncbi:MAG: hypothetical protein WAO74_07465 [Polaribacter sp.]|uniref:hypothetical protein n=1 Tax=Polaribacter sp. TaxID=1920175 RepID=UPI003BB1F022
MKITKKDTFTLISSDENSFREFYESFLQKEKEFKNEHLVLEISEKINPNTEDFLLFLSIAHRKQQNGTSFVIIKSNVNVDNFPEDFNIVPTLIEAEDILEMEAIERELGF